MQEAAGISGLCRDFLWEGYLGETESQAAAAVLTRDILSGALPPNGKPKVRDLSARYEIGPTPLREALSRLAARGLVERQGQRGFRVPPATRERLLNITHTRQVVEAEAFRLAVEHGGGGEDDVSASLLILRRASERHEPTEAWLDAYEERHRRFLRSLGSLQDGVIDMHQRLADRTLARDAAGGIAEIKAHIGSTATALLTILDAT